MFWENPAILADIAIAAVLIGAAVIGAWKGLVKSLAGVVIVVGALIGGGVFALLYFGAIALLKKEAMGFADVKLAAAAGLLLGWQKLIFAMLVASVVGSVVLIVLNRIKKQDRDTEYPFGPFIVGGILLALMAGEPILTWYVGLILG